jgi:hypothetical protein
LIDRRNKEKPENRLMASCGVALLIVFVIGELSGCGLFQKKGVSKLSLKMQLEPEIDRIMTKQQGEPLPDNLLNDLPHDDHKTVTPSTEWKVAKYTIEGVHADSSTLTLSSTDSNISVELKPGDWTFSVKAFAASDQELASGTKAVRLQPGRSSSLTVKLLPIQGQGSLELTIGSDYQRNPGEKIVGSLSYLGLPGYPKPENPSAIPIDISAGQSVFSVQAIDAGYYELNLSLLDSDGNAASGLADVVLVLTGFQTKGTCNLEVGNSSSTFLPLAIDVGPLASPVINVRHMLSYDATIVPMAVPESENGSSDLESSWYMNGQKLGKSLTGTDVGRFPPNTLFCPPISASPGLSKVQIGVVARSTTSGRATCANTSYDFLDGPRGGWSRWLAGYNYKSAMGLSVFRKGADGNTGTGNKATVRAVASSKNGIVAITGMDYDSAVHVFASPSGLAVGNDMQGPITLPPSASWARLWRDQFKIDGSAKNADVLAVSEDGLRIAATQSGSTSGWLKIYDLDASGDIVSTFTTSPSLGGPSGLRELKALCFSNDGSRLYAMSGQTKSLFSYGFDGSGWTLRSVAALAEVGSSSQNVRDLELTASEAVVISSGETSKLFVFKDDGTGSLSLEQTILPNASGYVLKTPSALAKSSLGDRFYVLSDGKEVLIYGRNDGSGAYTLQGGITLELSVASADSISVCKLPNESTNEVLCVVGSTDLGFYKIDMAGNVVARDTIHPDATNSSGLANADTVCSDGKSFLVGGGASGVVSVIEIQ